ncbi:LuxR C-terminal-related transcriptional regulator [Nocardia sp. NPDC050630]|uniref:LuxR C-terminal-related transcriptional regulator n=1 Tax=Nocardia sp. NPDC050630 TaxID=3364321 RepID=UPI00379C850E
MDRIFDLLLSAARLITLIGPGGIGKTRLATETVRRFRKTRGTLVYWVRLARLLKGSDATAVEAEVIAAVVDADFSGRSGWDALVDTLSATDEAGRIRRSVLVMDNCEHVLAGAGRVIAELLEAVPGLTILATSREAVGWADEHVVVVPSLTRQQAVTLFRQRAKYTGHSIVDRDDIAKATLICRHVNDHPLYIRLAAARLLRRSLASIIEELSGEVGDQRMRWSHGPRVGADARHQGVRDAIAWSYDLCPDKERLLLDRMSVFAAGYDINPEDGTSSVPNVGVDVEAIEAICADDPPHEEDQASSPGQTVWLAAEEVEGVLDRLIDQSLVTAHITPTAVRYSLLESIRVFAGQRLHEHSTPEVDEPARLARRHRRYYRDKIVAVQRNWFSPAEQGLLDWVRAAWDNLVRAIETSLTSGEPALGLEISVGLIDIYKVRSSPRDLRRWAERTLQATGTPTARPTDLQIKAMTVIGWLDLIAGKYDDADRMLEECVAASIRDPETRHGWRQTPETDIGLPAPVEYAWGAQLWLAQRNPEAISVFARAREKFRVISDHGGEARSSLAEAWAASFVGSAEQALQTSQRHLDYATASGAAWSKAWAQMARAIALTKHSSPTEALALGRSALAYLLQTHDRWGETWAVHIRMWSLAQIVGDMISVGSIDHAELRAQATEVAQLAGGAATLRAAMGFDKSNLGPYTVETTQAIDIARRALGPEVFAAAQRQGSLLRLELDEVQRLALGTLSMERLPINHPARRNTPARWHELSTAEQQVAILAAAGWTNSAIATRRGNSTKTVDAQMAAIFRKLVITSRDDIIKLIPEDQIGQVRSEAVKHPRRTGRQRSQP